MTDDDQNPSPIADLMRDRPEAFDYPDFPDITETAQRKRHAQALLEMAPPYLRSLAAPSAED